MTNHHYQRLITNLKINIMLQINKIQDNHIKQMLNLTLINYYLLDTRNSLSFFKQTIAK